MNTTPPGPDVSKGAELVGVIAFLHVISLSLYGTRIYTRIRPTLRLGMDDFFITVAVAFDMTQWILLMIGVNYGVGRHNYYVPPDQMLLAEKFLFVSQPPYAWGLAFAKLSIIWMLLRIKRDYSKGWIIILSTTMVIVVLVAITMNVFQFSICKPLAAVWGHSIPDPVCLAPDVIHTSVYVTAAVTIVTDVFLSLLPITFVVHIQRPLREKLVLGFLMGLGVFASVASIVKTTAVKDYGITGDDLMDSVGITIWSILEVQLAIIASCIPTLRQLFERVLKRLGLLSTISSRSRTGYLKQDESTGHQLTARMSHKRDTSKTLNDSDSDRNPTSPYFNTAIEAGASRVEAESQEQIITHGQGIQKQTTVSVHSFSKSSVDNRVV